MSEDQEKESLKTVEPATAHEEGGNALIPLYWFAGAVIMIVVLVLIGSGG